MKNQWISIGDRLPDTAHSKPSNLARIVTDGVTAWTTKQHSAYWNNSDLYEDCETEITHWMPLPEVP